MATAVDTSSAAAAAIAVVDADAAALAALIVEPIPARSVAAAEISSGAVMTNDTVRSHRFMTPQEKLPTGPSGMATTADCNRI
ncbi:hypothetical protein MSS2_03834 [Mycobacterium marinum]|nr:hypothetical protein MSS2_03834 [Mycobacterium marinum]